jgi:hypothetical protein
VNDVISVRKFEFSDLHKFQPREEERGLLKLEAFRDTLVNASGADGICTAWLGDEVFCIYMQSTSWTGNAEVGIMGSVFVAKKKKLFIRTTRTFLKVFENTFPNMRRIQAVGLADKAHDLLFEACGFTLECERMRSYFPSGADARLWARIREKK